MTTFQCPIQEITIILRSIGVEGNSFYKSIQTRIFTVRRQNEYKNKRVSNNSMFVKISKICIWSLTAFFSHLHFWSLFQYVHLHSDQMNSFYKMLKHSVGELSIRPEIRKIIFTNRHHELLYSEKKKKLDFFTLFIVRENNRIESGCTSTQWSSVNRKERCSIFSVVMVIYRHSYFK